MVSTQRFEAARLLESEMTNDLTTSRPRKLDSASLNLILNISIPVANDICCPLTIESFLFSLRFSCKTTPKPNRSGNFIVTYYIPRSYIPLLWTKNRSCFLQKYLLTRGLPSGNHRKRTRRHPKKAWYERGDIQKVEDICTLLDSLPLFFPVTFKKLYILPRGKTPLGTALSLPFRTEIQLWKA